MAESREQNAELSILKSKKIKDFGFRGIPKITIPYRDVDFADTDRGLRILKKFMPNIMSRHNNNAVKINFLHDYYEGIQDIVEKERLYQKDCKNNNIIVENHAYRQVNFKTGFICNDSRDYVYKTSTASDDLKYLNRYQTDVDFFSKDKDLKEYIYSTGIGTTYTELRNDIIIETNTTDDLTGQKRFRYADVSDGFDIETQAPFTFDVVNPAENFVVYSSGRNQEPLFCVSVYEVDDLDQDIIVTKKEMYIQSRYAIYKVNSDLGYLTFTEVEKVRSKVIRDIPIVEHSSNASRIGLIELNREEFNAINTLISSVSDSIVDSSNIILVFKNTDVDRNDIVNMRDAGAIVISDAQNARLNSTADLSTIKVSIDFDGINKYYEQRVTQAYDIAGVPLASGQVTSGGDTGQARLLGGGWSNAETVAKTDILSLKKGDYAVLRQIIGICKEVPNCPLNNLAASLVDINYHINQSDNLLVKTQGILNLYTVNMPKKMILKATGLFDDINTNADEWETNDQKVKSQETANTQISATSEIESSNEIMAETETTDNNSQE